MKSSNYNLAKVWEWHEIIDGPNALSVLLGEQPVVMRKFVSDWPIVEAGKESSGSLARYLMAFDIGAKFQAMLAAPEVGGRLFYGKDLKSFNFKRMNGMLKDAMDILLSFEQQVNTPAFYIGSKQISKYLPGLEKANRLELLEPDVEPMIWIGNAIRVATHNDHSQNIACIAAGARRFTLFPPDQEENLYIGPADITPGGRPISLVDLNNPDFKKYPRVEKALDHALVADLEAGDALYIPTHWWHNVESLSSFNVLINYWWQGSAPKIK